MKKKNTFNLNMFAPEILEESSCAADGCGNPGATTVRNPLTLLAPIIDSGIDPLYIWWPEFALLPFLFEANLNSAGDKLIGLKLKDPSRFIAAKYTNGNCAVQWTERYDCLIQTDLVSVTGSAHVVNVTNIAELRGIGAGAQILISNSVDGASQVATVVSISTNAITVTETVTVTTAGSKVSRLMYNPASSTQCNGNATNVYTTSEEGVYSSPFRRIWLTFSLDQCDLSIERFISADPGRAFLDDMVAGGAIGAKNEFASVFYMDNGWEHAAGSDINANQTFGIIPGIQYAQTTVDKNFIHDFAACAADEELSACERDEAMVLGWYTLLMKMYDTGIYNGKPITITCNKLQMDELRFLVKTFADVHEISVVFNPGDSFQSIYNSLAMIRLPFGYVNVEIYYDRFLDYFQLPFMVAMPAHRVFLMQRPFYNVSASDTGAMSVVNTAVASGSPRFKFIDRTIIDGDGSGECIVMKAFMDIAVVPQAIFTGAYRIFMNFKNTTTPICLPSCTTGDPTQDTLVTLT